MYPQVTPRENLMRDNYDLERTVSHEFPRSKCPHCGSNFTWNGRENVQKVEQLEQTQEDMQTDPEEVKYRLVNFKSQPAPTPPLKLTWLCRHNPQLSINDNGYSHLIRLIWLTKSFNRRTFILWSIYQCLITSKMLLNIGKTAALS